MILEGWKQYLLLRIFRISQEIFMVYLSILIPTHFEPLFIVSYTQLVKFIKVSTVEYNLKTRNEQLLKILY